jgi:BlaI family penicillinase repressor
MPDISNTEFEVLEALWQKHPATANDIIDRLNLFEGTKKGQSKNWHDKTVKTLLNRLVKKEAISFEKQQRHYIYTHT